MLLQRTELIGDDAKKRLSISEDFLARELQKEGYHVALSKRTVVPVISGPGFITATQELMEGLEAGGQCVLAARYLGPLLTHDCTLGPERGRRIQAAEVACKRMAAYWSSSAPAKERCEIFKGLAHATLLTG